MNAAEQQAVAALGRRAVRAQHGLAGGVAVLDGEREWCVASVFPKRERGGGALYGAERLKDNGVIVGNCAVQRRPAAPALQLQPGAALEQQAHDTLAP